MLQMRKFLLSICVAGAVAESAMAGRINVRREDHAMFARQATSSGTSTAPAGSATTAPAASSSSAAAPVSSATTSQGPSPTPLIFFHFVGTLQSCSSAQVTWDYNGPSGETLDLNITNVHVEQPTSVPWIPNAPKVNQTDAIGNKTILVNDIVVTGLDVTSESYNWSPVKMRQGWYVLKGTINDDATYSPMFYIANGTDTACIPKPTPLPGTVVPKKKSEAGAIAGGVVGALGLGLIAALALCLICRRRRTKRAKQDPSWAALKRSGSKGGISSRSSSISKSAAGAGASVAKHSRSGSLDPTEEMSPYKDAADHEKNDAPQTLPALHLVGGALDVPSSPNPFADSVSSSFSNRNSRTSILFDSNPFDDNSAIVPPSATRTSDGSVLYDFAPYSSPAPTRSRYSEDFGDSEARVTHPPPVPVRIPSTKEVDETEDSPPTPRQSNFTRKPVVYNDEDVFADPMYADMEPARRTSFTSSANTSGMFTAQQSLADLNDSGLDLAQKSNLGDLGMGVKPVHSIIPDMPPLPKSEWA